ncbi:GMC family oxidoreductase [Medicago truncatula]|uniref:GMC family oxidoreductase n=1 Tax=Medicago truncatula TaxID=3880 RepID=A0A072TCW7_MEDTR|nr:GMC family oxidoreductase [Medicago truncatula]
MRGSGSLNREFYGTQLLKNALRYYLTRTGPLATGAMSVGAFVRSSPQVHRPDIQLYMDGVTFGIANGNSKVQVPLTRVERQPGLSIYAHLLRCTSEGTVMVTSTDPAVSPAISPNWLSTEADRQTAIHATHYMRRYVTQTAVAPKIDHEFFPGGSLQQSNDDIVSIWRKYATTGIHGVGTCRMGGDALAVVDHRLRVNGVEGLRIVDYVRVEALEGADLVTGIRLTSGELLACDLLVVGVGITPEIGPLLDAGAKTENGVVVDEMCATSLPDVVAVVIAQHIRTYRLKIQTVGLPVGYDQTVVRGEIDEASFAIVYLKQGKVVALDCVNMPRDYMQGRWLVLACASIDPVFLSDALNRTGNRGG